MRDTHGKREREMQAPCREPDVGLNPRTPGSCPGLKAALNRWATQGSPKQTLRFFTSCPLHQVSFVTLTSVLLTQWSAKPQDFGAMLSLVLFYFIFLSIYLSIYLFIRHRMRGRDTGRGRSRLPAGSPMRDSILGLQDHALGWRRG